RLDAHIRITKTESVEATQGGGELILPATRQFGFHRLQVPALLRDVALRQPLASGQPQRRDERHVHGPRGAEPGPAGRVAARGEGAGRLYREHPQRGLQEIEAPVEHETPGIRALE